MTQFTKKSFSVGGYSEAYSKGWDRLARDKDDRLTNCVCGSSEFYATFDMAKQKVVWRCAECGEAQ